MNLYIAIRGNKRGTIYDLTEEGLEELYLRKNPETGQEVPAGYTGLILPFSAMEDVLLKMPTQSNRQVDKKFHEHRNH